jgi:hypothetical protein
MEDNNKTIIKGKIWKAGTNTLVFGISKRDQEYCKLEEGDLLTAQIIDIRKKPKGDIITKKELKKVIVNETNENKKKFNVS